MLYADMTTGAVVAGYAVGTNGELTGAQAEELEAALAELNDEHGAKIELIVPGDSRTDHSHDPSMQLYAFDVVFGVAAFSAGPWECPAEVSSERVQQAVDTVQDTPAAFWEDLSAKMPLLADFAPDAPEVYLTSWGPLPYACLVAGVLHPSDESDSTTHDFHSVQDMSQRWLDHGVDGQRLACVEFTDIRSVDLSPEAVAARLEEVDDLDDPKVYMTVRYD